MADAPRGRRTFGPVVLLAGLSAGALAMAGGQAWFTPEGGSDECLAPCAFLVVDRAEVPAATALGLVALACLGVVLVTRGRFRVASTVVGMLGSLGALAAVVDAWRLPEDLRDAATDIGAVAPGLERTGWLWIGTVAAVAGVLAWGAALRHVRAWPEMGRKYDAAGRPAATAPPDDLWKAIDQGHDPTS